MRSRNRITARSSRPKNCRLKRKPDHGPSASCRASGREPPARRHRPVHGAGHATGRAGGPSTRRGTPSGDYVCDAFARMSRRRSKLSAGQTASKS
jgi:hypothetical protein